MCGEALYKYAASCTIFAATRSIQAAVGDFQYGAGRSGGAALQLAEVHAEALANPEDALASLDVRNAFGAISWADALRIITAVAPKLAPFLSVIWSPGHQVIWTQATQPGQWMAAAICGSLVQGGPEAHYVFCLVMAEVLRDVQRSMDASAHPDSTSTAHPDSTSTANDPATPAPTNTISLFLWAYVDDITFKCRLPLLCEMLRTMRSALSRYGCELQPKKCNICVPNLRDVPAAQWPTGLLGAALMGFNINNSVLPLLGSDAAAAHAV